MALSPHTTRRFGTVVVYVLAAAAIGAQVAQASDSCRLITDNSASQNRVAASQRDYGPPDPWMFGFKHHDNLISENSASQNRVAASQRDYGPLDPWLARLMRSGNRHQHTDQRELHTHGT